MKQVCLLCDRTSPDNNLFCQESYCTAEQSPSILEFGEWLSDIEIVRPLVVQRSAVLYEANYHNRRVLLKVAHPGPEHKERLKREAEFLRDCQLANQQNRYLPLLLSPEIDRPLSAQRDPYGKTILRRHLLYYVLFEHAEGEPLRDILKKNPQLWLRHVGWIALSLAGAVAFLHSKGRLHFGLSTESLLVHIDEKSNVPRVTLFDLGICADIRSLAQEWYHDFTSPANVAPEFLGAASIQPDYRTDVYGLGLILYELLVGEPTYPVRLRSDEDIYQIVQRAARVPMIRSEDVHRLADIALQAVDPQPGRRQDSAQILAKELQTIFGAVPEPKSRRWPSLANLLLIFGGLLLSALLIVVIILLF